MLASDHTRLINCVIGLCNKTDKWPSALRDVGYKVQLIEQTLKLHSGGVVVPDVVAVSNQCHHILIVDCKSGRNINSEQNERYSQLTSDVLFRFVDVHEPSKFNHKFCYADTQAHHANLKSHTEHPFVTFSADAIKGEGDFGELQTNKNLHQTIRLDDMREPTNFYPFSHSDNNDLITFYVLQGLVSHITKKSSKKIIDDEFLARELLEITHLLYKTIGTEHKNQLVRKINEILKMLKGNNEFDECIRKINNGEGSIATFQKLLSICDKIITNIQQNPKLTEFVN